MHSRGVQWRDSRGKGSGAARLAADLPSQREEMLCHHSQLLEEFAVRGLLGRLACGPQRLAAKGLSKLLPAAPGSICPPTTARLGRSKAYLSLRATERCRGAARLALSPATLLTD
jgi:hypothetical protein